MAKTKTVRVTEEELAALQALRAGQPVVEEPAVAGQVQVLADALTTALERNKKPEKKMAGFRKRQTPWTPEAGTPQLKMKRVFYHHGLLLGDKISNDEIALLNQIKPGVYCDGWVRVTLRKDRGIDIDYPVKTASQRLKLVNIYGVRSFEELLRRIIDEKANPKKYRTPEDADLYDLE